MVSKFGRRIKYFLNAWTKITNDPLILSYVKGYKIPFIKKVFQNYIPCEPRFSSREKKACKNSIADLIQKGAISPCKPCKGQFLSSYFLRLKPNGDYRFILNLKKLNEFIVAPHFKMEDIKTALKLITRNCFMATIDLKDSYFLIPISKKFRKFLRFSFNNQLYEFNVLPFGLSTAP